MFFFVFFSKGWVGATLEKRKYRLPRFLGQKFVGGSLDFNTDRYYRHILYTLQTDSLNTTLGRGPRKKGNVENWILFNEM